MAKFSNVKVGDKLWSIQLGDCKVVGISESTIDCGNDKNIEETYMFDGKYFGSDSYPSLYWSNPNIVDESPFNLKEYLGEKLKPKKFRVYECNYYIEFLGDDREYLSYDFYNERTRYSLGTLYFYEDNIKEVVETLNSRKIELSELIEVMNELNILWNI